MKKRYLLVIKTFILFLVAMMSMNIHVYASADTINEKFGQPIVVYGESLSEQQKQEVLELLSVYNPETVQELIVTAEDLVNYINGNPDANKYSSAKITRKETVMVFMLRL